MTRLASKREKGQSLTELALSFTLLLLIVGGVLELGTIFYTLVALRDSAQEGVLYASIDPTDQSGKVEQRIRDSANWPIDADKISSIIVSCGGVACQDSSPLTCQGQEISVEISYAYKPTTPLIFFSSIPLTSKVSNTILRSTLRDDYIATHPGTPNCP